MIEPSDQTATATQQASARACHATTEAQWSRSACAASLNAVRRRRHHGQSLSGPGVSTPGRSQKPPQPWQRPGDVRAGMMSSIREFMGAV